MSENRDEQLRAEIQKQVDQIFWSREQAQKNLAEIHRRAGERSKIMRLPKKGIMIAAAAAILATGSITAIAAGKIAWTSSSTNKNEAIYSVSELKKQAEEKLGTNVVIPDQLSDGSTFEEGYVTQVNAHDENGNVVNTYPEIRIHYSGMLSVSIEKGIGESDSSNAPDYHENYHGISIYASEDNYLFLPPDAEPSEEDRKLEEEGKLYISYGSSQEERKVFRFVKWSYEGVNYMVHAFDDKSVEDLVALAKGYIDAE